MSRVTILAIAGIALVCVTILTIDYFNTHKSAEDANKYPYITKSRDIEFDESISNDGNSIGINYWLWYDGKIIAWSENNTEWVKLDNLKSREEEFKIWANDQIMLYQHLEHEK